MKAQKVYKVLSGNVDRHGIDYPDYAIYVVIAYDAQQAIEQAVEMFVSSNEYPREVTVSDTMSGGSGWEWGKIVSPAMKDIPQQE